MDTTGELGADKASVNRTLILVGMRLASICIQLINACIWLNRYHFSERAHIAHWSVGCLALLLTLPVVEISDHLQFLVFLECVCTLSLVATFQYFTALAPLHGALMISLALIGQTWLLFSRKEPSFGDALVTFSEISIALVPFLLIAAALSFS